MNTPPVSLLSVPALFAIALGLSASIGAKAAIDQVYENPGRPDAASWIIATATSPDYCTFPSALTIDVDSGGTTVKKVLLGWTAAGDGTHPANAFRQKSTNGGITFDSPVVTPIAFANALRKKNGTIISMPFWPAVPYSYYTSTDNGGTLTAHTDGTFATWQVNSMGMLEENDGSLYLFGYTSGSSKVSKSTDGGVSWTGLATIATVNVPTSGFNYSEISVERCLNGSWLAVMRVAPQNMRYARSTDQGATWTTPALLSGITSVGVAPCLKLMPNGVLVLGWGEDTGTVDGRNCKFALSADGNGTSWTNITTPLTGQSNVLESTGYSAICPMGPNRFMYVSDTGTSWSYTDGYQASDYRVWGHIVDIVPSLKNRIDLSGKYAAGSITITTDLTYSDSAHLETRLTGAFDGSTDYWSGAFKSATTGSYTIDLQQSQTLTAVGVALKYNTAESATVDYSTNGTSWTTLKTYTNAKHNAIDYTTSTITARYVRVNVTGGTSPISVNEIELYSNADTFENYAVGIVPYGYTSPSNGFWITDTQTPLPSGYQSKRALIMYDGQTGAQPTITKTTMATTSKTLEFRYRSKTFAPSGAHQFYIRSGTTTVYHMAVFSDGSIRYYNGSWVVLAAAGTVPLDTWTLIKAVATISPATASVYVNGVLKGTALKENTGPTTMDNFMFATTGTVPVGDMALLDDIAF